MYRTLLFSLLLFITGTVSAQQELTFNNNTRFFVDGTSTLHDWTIESDKITGKVVMSETGQKITSVELSLPVESLKSGKSGMDRRVYDAFDTKKNPTISFTSSTITLSDDGKEGVAKGKLTFAGATRDAEIPFSIAADGSNWKFTGSVDLKMTSFNMSPPTAMMGTVRAGDDVTVRFEVVTRKPTIASR